MSKNRKNKQQLSPEEVGRFTRTFWKVIFGCVAFVFLLLMAVGLGVFGKLPSLASLENPDNNYAAEVLSSDGTILGTFYDENRSYVNYDQISPNLIKALVSTEDERFYQHSGIDFKRTVASAIFTLFGDKQGGSTISQQLALNLYGSGRADNFMVRVMQKLREWVTAVRLERRYTKQEIITMYLNTVDFGNNSYGIKMAARSYFDTTPDKLTVNQSALLVGLLKGTSRFSPLNNEERAKARRNTVLGLMRKHGEISAEQYAAFTKEPIVLDLQPTQHDRGLAPYFREFLRLEVTRLINDGEVKRKENGEEYDVYRDGLKIHTTINTRMQRYAEEAVREHLTGLQADFKRHWKGRIPWKGLSSGPNPVFDDKAITINTAIKRSERYRKMLLNDLPEDSIKAGFTRPVRMKVFSWDSPDYSKDTVMSPLDSIIYYKWFLRSAFMALDPQTGHIKAWVGGPDYRYFKFDMVKLGKRQVGSTFKPIVYTEAIEDFGYKPCFPVPNIPVEFPDFLVDGKPYKPQNSDYSFGGVYTLREGLAKSLNVVTMYLIKHIGPASVVDRAEKMGISADMEPYPSIGLGVFETTLYDMVSAFSAFANRGMRKPPVFITHIEDRNGNIIYNKINVPIEAMSEQTAYTMLHMLKGTSEVSGGTAMRLRGTYGFTNPIAAKTGTTQNNVDGWFLGAVPNLVAGVWTGGDDQTVHFRDTRLGQGANMALPVWGRFMQKVYKDTTLEVSKEDFPLPSDSSINLNFDCSAYHVPETADSTFVPEELPENRLDF
ncbi:penicillin-binding protein 1A [Anseongella ginsenosidimutans]|uniref:Penicillin-binding protein 1A n=1 Tax=Anseongella ginsenosidimutans TaxID=496056 RepID=A0A4R3KXL9_9SPHI|nr:transglycosylase domain-containing protein [Anseongella ginsenosidimutans]QEC51177.1 penicillin-binding protein [Anseongella ginsenosidimutans]TCS90151.1 penicillin-binding protein 1A [Anseongella ginsenosidimutans]